MSAAVLSIGLALPTLQLRQQDIAAFMSRQLGLDTYGDRRLRKLYDMSGIDTRHSVVADFGRAAADQTFYPSAPDQPPPGYPARMELYRHHAPLLALEAARDCLSRHATRPDQITHLITVSCTGLYAPGLDIELAEALELSPFIERTAVNFMGCYAAFPALKLADYIVRAEPDARVLVVCVELCTLHFHPRTDDDHLVANALFADGCAVALVGNVNAGQGQALLRLDSFFSTTVPAGRGDMAWQLGEDGFEIGLSSYVPDLIRGGIGELFARLVARAGGAAPEHFAVHPGGVRILRAAQQVMGLSADDLAPSYAVLRRAGNMSSATILFVLRDWLDRLQGGGQQRLAACAFGPGLTLESLIGEVIS
jgi:predicted naringenin-chalcone synthase